MDSHSVRDAHFLGDRNDEKKVAWFDAYTKRLSLPDTGPYLSLIGLFTPYAQVASRSESNTVGYRAQQTEEDYRSHSGTIQARVRIEFTVTYTVVRGHNSAKDTSNEEDSSYDDRPTGAMISLRHTRN